MAKTNFSGPITTGPIQVNTGTTVGTNVRDAAFIANSMSFPFTYASFAYATDADKLAIAASNPTSTESVTLVDATQNVPGITAIGGFEMASMITITSGSSDSGTDAVITGTDVLGNSQTETLALSSSVTSVKTYKTVTSIELDAGSAGTITAGILKTAAVSVVCRSLFNADPLAQTSSTTGKNLANNIVIPAWSRITDIRQNNTVVYSENMFIQIGANVAQAAGATLNSHDLDYFAGRSATTDVKALGSMHLPLYMYQDADQQDNCMNVAVDDASGYEVDKAVIMTVNFGDTPTTGTSYLTIDWLQRVNNTN